MNWKGNPDGLRNAAQQKRNEALERTEKAISLMVKQGKKINFQTVAEAAGVSVAYLYKYDAIKQRIDQLRKQQSSIKALPQKQRVSDDSNKAIMTTLKKRISDLQAEVRGLRDHIEVVEGRAFEVPDLKQQVEGLRTENSKLREQLSHCMTSKSACPRVESKSFVTPLSLKKAVCPIISNQLQSELELLGIKVNSTLAKLIEAESEEVVLMAINALKEAKASYEVLNPSGFLVEAIKKTWMPNEGYERKVELDCFNEWYELARQRGLVLASQAGKNGILVYTKDEKWVSFQKLLIQYPLESFNS
jgi:chromosome segregation ATPase